MEVFENEDSDVFVVGTHDREVALRWMGEWCRGNGACPPGSDIDVEFGWFVSVDPTPGYDVEYCPCSPDHGGAVPMSVWRCI